MGTDWNKVAYSNAYSAAKSGQSLSHIISNQPDYASASTSAYNAYKSSVKKATPSKSSSKSSPSTVAATPTVAKVTTPKEKVEVPAPTLNLPALKLGEDASVTNQRDKILRYDSLPMQQARTQARENGTPSGQIQSSQQEGAAMRALSSEATALGEKEAALKAGEQISNWKQKTTEATMVYQNQYTERLKQMDIDSNMAQLMATLNSNLAQSMLSSTTSLMNNTDLEVDQGSMDRLISIVNNAQDNNNTVLGMGFTY